MRKSEMKWCLKCHKRARISLNGIDVCTRHANELMMQRNTIIGENGGLPQRSARTKAFEEWAKANDPDALRTEPNDPLEEISLTQRRSV